MAITTTCSGCGKTLAVADQFAGRQARCPSCNTIYTVPQPSPPPSPLKDVVAAADWGDPFDKRPIELNSVGSIEPLPSPAVPNPKRPDLATTIGANTENEELPEFLDSSKLDSTRPDSSAPIELEPIRPGSAPPAITPLSSLDRVDTAREPMLYWMRAADGNEYGPADDATLARWFREGRVGPNYVIRQGDQEQWQPALRFAPSPQSFASSANPFSSPVAVNSTPYVYAKSDQSALVLAMGILAWLGFCPIFGLIAWAVGAQSLHDMQVGNSDPTNRSLVQFGYYLGMANVILWAGCIGFGFLSSIL